MATTFYGYANYGVLSAEKKVVYTAGMPAECVYSEKGTFKLPAGWSAAEGISGGIIIENSAGDKWPANRIIATRGDKPVLRWYDGEKYHYRPLKFYRD